LTWYNHLGIPFPCIVEFGPSQGPQSYSQFLELGVELGYVEPKCLADPDTLLGMLERGRGAGYLLAVETTPVTVWPLLIECITNDPRLDRQVEYRADYYASLILETKMDIALLRDHLKQKDGPNDLFFNVKLTIETLNSLVVYHHAKALNILQDYISYGSHWHYVIISLWSSDVDGVIDGVDRILYDRLSTDQTFREDFQSNVIEDWQAYYERDENARYGLLLPMCEPWKTMCRRNARLAALFDQFCPSDTIHSPTRKKDTAIADLMQLSISELFTIMDRPDRPIFYKVSKALEQSVSLVDEDLLLKNLSDENEYKAMLALKGLGILGTPRAFEAVKSIIEFTEEPHSRVRARAFDAIAQMPSSLSLEIGRNWFHQDKWHFQVAGGRILENHATPEDIPLLIDVLKTPKTLQCEDFRLSSALEAFWHLDSIGHIPEIENVFTAVPHSYHRWRAAYAMATTAPNVFQTNYAYECLWDCHWHTRICGCENVSLSQPGVLAKLNEILEDPNENDEVREAAKLTIDEF
jgi:hypothetical protein